jgi:heptosyltransferase-3
MAPVTDSAPPTPVPRLLKFLYWRVRRNPRVAPHVMAVLFGFSRNYLALWLRKHLRRARSPTMAIALVEHMGDIVAAEPIARAARQRFPRHRIIWLAKSAYAELVASYRTVDRVVTVRCLTETMLLNAAGVLVETWDLHLRGRICEHCCIPVVKPGPGPDMDSYFRFGNLITTQCLSAGIPPVTGGPMLAPPPHAVAKVDRLGLPARFVAIHCISNDEIKDWPDSNWQRVVAAITDELHVDVVELGLRPLVIARDGERTRSLCGQLSIMETAEVIRRAALFIGIDSGPAHLANAVGTQGVVLLGPYLGQDDYMPYNGGYQDGSTADLLRAAGAAKNVPVATVLLAVSRRLQCADVAAAPADAARPR